MTFSVAWALGQKLYHFQSQLSQAHRRNVSSFAVYSLRLVAYTKQIRLQRKSTWIEVLCFLFLNCFGMEQNCESSDPFLMNNPNNVVGSLVILEHML